MTSLFALLFSAFASAALLSACCLRRVPDGHVYSLHRRGRPARLLDAGLHWVMPLRDRVVHRIQLGGQVLTFNEALAGAQGVQGRVYWQVLEPERADAVIDQAPQLIRGGAVQALREVPAVAADNCRELGGRLKQALNGALRERGMMVTRVELELA